MGNAVFTLLEDRKIVEGTLPDGTIFWIDSDVLPLIQDKVLYRSGRKWSKYGYVVTSQLEPVHGFVLPHKVGFEIDHINFNTLDNRRINLRYCTHQQNQMNQVLQKNNTSGVTGVRYYAPRQKFVARIKVGQYDIHLGYYSSFEEAVQARNAGMVCMFGEYGRYNDVSDPPEWIRKKVINQCKRFIDLSVCEAFLNTGEWPKDVWLRRQIIV